MEPTSNVENKRPKIVWVIFLWYILSPCFTIVSFVMINSGFIPVTPAQSAYFNSLTGFDYAMTVVVVLLTIAGAVAIFLLRKVSFHLFVTALVLSVLATLWNVISKGALAALGSTGFVGVLIGFGILAAVCWYALELRNRGVLK